MRKGSNKGIAKAAKERRREEAEVRNTAYQARPIKERMKTAGAKERAKLEAKMGASDEKR
jgi:hypothetical protein